MEMELCVRRGNMLPCKILECYIHLSSEQLKILFSDILKISWDCFLKSEIKCNIILEGYKTFFQLHSPKDGASQRRQILGFGLSI